MFEQQQHVLERAGPPARVQLVLERDGLAVLDGAKLGDEQPVSHDFKATLLLMERAGFEHAGWTRLRWRLRGAWMWPTFLVLTAGEAALIHALPVAGDATPVFSALLIAGFANLVVVAALAPIGGLLLRRRRADLPKLIAADYAGTTLLVAAAAGFLAAGLLHHRAVIASARERAAAVDAASAYVAHKAPVAFARNAGSVDLHGLGQHEYRACVRGPDPQHWLCVFVSTAQSPPGVTRDSSMQSNEVEFPPAL